MFQNLTATFRRAATAAAALGIMAIAVDAGAASFTNGDFENGLTGFTVTGGAASQGSEGRTDGVAAVQFNGGQGPADGVISQSFDTTNGQQYSVQFDFGNFAASVHQQVQAEVRDGTGLGGALLINPGSGSIQSDTNAAPTSGVFSSNTNVIQVQDDIGAGATTSGAPTDEFSRVTFTFTAASGTSTIIFRDQGTGGADSSDGILDRVVITAVPEPATLGMLGMMGLGLLSRRRGRHQLV